MTAGAVLGGAECRLLEQEQVRGGRDDGQLRIEQGTVEQQVVLQAHNVVVAKHDQRVARDRIEFGWADEDEFVDQVGPGDRHAERHHRASAVAHEMRGLADDRFEKRDGVLAHQLERQGPSTSAVWP